MKSEKAFIAASLLVLILAASLRIYHIGQRSLWFDEAIAAEISQHNLADTIALTRGMHSAPLAHPLLLSAIERFTTSAFAVRAPSLIFSLCAVALMFCFSGKAGLDRNAGILTALMLCVSASQIRYAQEVREYSLSVFYAGILIYTFLRAVARNEKTKSSAAFYIALFAAPLVQYGLVLFGAATLLALFIVETAQRRIRHAISTALAGGVCLSAGSLLAYFSTLRYQWGQKAWYLEDAYWSHGSSLLRFVWMNSHRLLAFLLPGLPVAVLAAVAVIVALVYAASKRTFPPVLVLACTSFGIVLACAILDLYPYDSVRQCLFLAPIACLCAGMSLAQIANRFPERISKTIVGLVACFILISGAFQLRSVRPYQEVEDIQALLVPLNGNVGNSDWVYVYCGAVPAIDFYLGRHDRFVWGNFHREQPGRYRTEFEAGIPSGATRAWIVFSHVYEQEDQRILSDLNGEWKSAPVAQAKLTALYSLTRISNASLASHNTDRDTAAATDVFKDWSIKNSAMSAH